jgi:hypothetical protein
MNQIGAMFKGESTDVSISWIDQWLKNPTCFLFLVSSSWFNERKWEIKVSGLVSFSFSFNDPKKEVKIYSKGVFFMV